MQSRLRDLLLRHAEAQLDAELVRLHRVDCLEAPEGDEADGDQADHDRIDARSAGNDVFQPVLAAPDEILQIRGRALRTTAARSLPPRSAAIAAATPRAA